MKTYVIGSITGLMFISTNSYAAGGHDNWIDVDSVLWGVGRVQEAQGQIAKLGRTDTATSAGKKAKIMQNRLRAAKGKSLSKQDANGLKSLIRQMDQTAKSGIR